MEPANIGLLTDHYTDYLPGDLQAISKAQRLLLTGNIAER